MRVVPDVSGIDKEFDYFVPDSLQAVIEIGSLVRVELANRKVNGWVTQIDPPETLEISRLSPVLAWRGIGPQTEVVNCAAIIARQFMGRRRSLLSIGSPDTLVKSLPIDRRHLQQPGGGPLTDLHKMGGGLIWCANNQDPLEVVLAAARFGPLLVVMPSIKGAKNLAAGLRGAGFSVAAMPEDWAAARAGVDIVIGARGAVWAPVVDLSTVLVWDEHDEALTEERVPTWNVRDVAIDRSGAVGASCFLVSPIPSPAALRWAEGRIYKTHSLENDKWLPVEVIDLKNGENANTPRGMVSLEAISELRDPSKTVLCILNSTGVAKLLSCRSCDSIARCENCDSVLSQIDDEKLFCTACESSRPLVCAKCGSGSFKNLKRGTAKLKSELTKIANRSVIEITAAKSQEIPTAGKFVAIGTEALLHRARDADTVIFLNIDNELNTGFYRANEIVLALVLRALRLVGEKGRVLVQTDNPNRGVLSSISTHDIPGAINAELSLRENLDLPPFTNLAKVSGPGASDFFANLLKQQLPMGVGINQTAGLVRAQTSEDLVQVIEETRKLIRDRIRVEIQPLRA